MLYTVQRYTRQDTYSGIVKKLYGRKMEIFVDIVQVILLSYFYSSYFTVLVLVLVMLLLLLMNYIFVSLICYNVNYQLQCTGFSVESSF